MVRMALSSGDSSVSSFLNNPTNLAQPNIAASSSGISWLQSTCATRTMYDLCISDFHMTLKCSYLAPVTS